MERDRFDRLVRLFGEGRNRRDALRLAATAALFGGAVAVDDAAARRKRRKPRSVRSQAVTSCTNICRDCTGKPIGAGVSLTRCDFDDESFVDGLNLSSSNLANACFARAELRGAQFNSATVSGVCFLDADLRNANFRSSNVRNAVFCGADLRGADFRSSNVKQSQLDCAEVGCTTILPNGKPAVVCGPCAPCNADGDCEAVPNQTVACDGTPLTNAGIIGDCISPGSKGICVDGQCSCGPGIYNSTENTCSCSPGQCPAQLPCCTLSQLCADSTGVTLSNVSCTSEPCD